jgi:hypothetical protein
MGQLGPAAFIELLPVLASSFSHEVSECFIAVESTDCLQQGVASLDNWWQCCQCVMCLMNQGVLQA